MTADIPAIEAGLELWERSDALEAARASDAIDWPLWEQTGQTSPAVIDRHYLLAQCRQCAADIAALIADLRAAQEREQRVRELHRPEYPERPDGARVPICEGCSREVLEYVPYPCATISVLDGEGT